MIFVADFVGTIAKNAYSMIGELYANAIEILRAMPANIKAVDASPSTDFLVECNY